MDNVFLSSLGRNLLILDSLGKKLCYEVANRYTHEKCPKWRSPDLIAYHLDFHQDKYFWTLLALAKRSLLHLDSPITSVIPIGVANGVRITWCWGSPLFMFDEQRDITNRSHRLRILCTWTSEEKKIRNKPFSHDWQKAKRERWPFLVCSYINAKRNCRYRLALNRLQV